MARREELLQARLAPRRYRIRPRGGRAPGSRPKGRAPRLDRQPPEHGAWSAPSAAGCIGLTCPSSQLDVLYIGRLFPKTCVVMAKKELKYTPLLGQLCDPSHKVIARFSGKG